MFLVRPSVEILQFDDNSLIERAGRTCYKSEDKITEDSANDFAAMLLKRGHHAMIEFGSATVRIICDRGVSHEIVRHRLFSFAQESSYYCNYSKDRFGKQLTFIIPIWIKDIPTGQYVYDENTKRWYVNEQHYNFNKIARIWLHTMYSAELAYMKLLEEGATAQFARGLLPTSTKTELVCKANFREWLHFFELRTDKVDHSQMQEIANAAKCQFASINNTIFGGNK